MKEEKKGEPEHCTVDWGDNNKEKVENMREEEQGVKKEEPGKQGEKEGKKEDQGNKGLEVMEATFGRVKISMTMGSGKRRPKT